MTYKSETLVTKETGLVFISARGAFIEAHAGEPITPYQTIHAGLIAVAPMIAAREREMCAKVAAQSSIGPNGEPDMPAIRAVAAIRARNTTP